MADPTLFDVYQILHSGQENALDRMLKAFADQMDHYHKMLALPAAMAGLVVPLLASQRQFVNIVVLGHATIWLCAAVVVGVLELAIGRWLFAYQMNMTTAEFRRQMKPFGDAAGDVDKFVALADFELPDTFKKTLSRMKWLAGLGDLFFYGSILGGIIEIARAVLTM
jgi:hypothetical protein